LLIRPHSITNLAKLVSILIREGILRISFLDHLEFVHMPPAHVFFVRALFTNLMLEASDEQLTSIMRVIAPTAADINVNARLAGTASKLSGLRSSLLIFLEHAMTFQKPASDAAGEKRQRTIRERTKLVRRVLKATPAAMYAE
jgi:hypothetical protein